MLAVLTGLDPAPESVPINCLMAMPGTPLEDQPPVDIFDLVRLVATTRIALPRARVRLSAGRTRLSPEGQALCFFAGANSVFYGDKLLTAANPAARADLALLRALDLRPHTLPASSRNIFAAARRKFIDDGRPFAAHSAHMVKKVFPLLLSYVFLTTQCWAISGGPDYGTRHSQHHRHVFGVHHRPDGVRRLHRRPDIPGDTLPTADTTTTTNSNALGLFDSAVPTTGTAHGAFLLFADGSSSAAPSTGRWTRTPKCSRALFRARTSFNLTTFTSTGTTDTTAVTAQALGMIVAKIAGTKTSSNVDGPVDRQRQPGRQLRHR